MAISVGFFISGTTSTGLCSGPFTIELFTTTPPLVIGSDLFLNAGGTIYPPDPAFYSDGINVYSYKGRQIDGIVPCPTPTPTPTPNLTATPTPTPNLTATPTPTVSVPYSLDTCDIIFNFGGAIFGYVFSTNVSTNITSLFTPSPVGSDDIAHTTTKLWMYNPSYIQEYDITLSPFSVTFNRDITLPSSIGAGLGVIDNTTLISTVGGDIVEIDITTSTAVITPKFTIPSGRVIAGDMVYTYSAPNKLICTYTDFSNTYITQHDYTTGTIEVDELISPTIPDPYGIFMLLGNLYICNSNGQIYNFNLSSPYSLTFEKTAPNSIFGASQPPECADIVIEPGTPTPTPTRTVTPTPTRTPTPTPTSTPPIVCPTSCLECGESYSAYSETQCYSLDVVSATAPLTPISFVDIGYSQYSVYGSFVYNPGYSISGFTNPIGGDYVLLPSNTLWDNPSLNTTDGPLNRCGVWTVNYPLSAPPYNVWLGFSQCIDIVETKTYYIGIGGDNDFKLKIDGSTIVDSSLSTYWNTAGRTYKRWNIYPLTLNSGNHIIELYGRNDGSYGGFGCEIYDNTLPELNSATLYSDLNIIFTSSGKTQATLVQSNAGVYLTSGYTCSSGYIYNSCDNTCVKYNFCDICPEPPIICPFETYCISTGNVLYDDTYISGGTWNEQIYWEGITNGLLIYYSSGDDRWCLSDSLDGDCFLFGPSPCNSDCPDLCDNFFTGGSCPIPTPTPTQYCQPISFEAAFDCELPLTPTATVTGTPTPTPTPTPTATEICGGKGISVTVNVLTPTPTATSGKMVPTPTASPQYNCNFDGSVTFNTFDDYIRCNGSKSFKDCVSGFLYYTTDVVLDPFGETPAEEYVYQSFVNGISTCITYEGFVSDISGVSTIVLTGILGPKSDGACSQCVIINTPTPTPTLTSTPTPTASSPLPICYQYLVVNNYIKPSPFTYTLCSTGSPITQDVNSYGSTTICSSTIPTTTSNFITITNTGICD